MVIPVAFTDPGTPWHGRFHLAFYSFEVIVFYHFGPARILMLMIPAFLVSVDCAFGIWKTLMDT